MGKGMIGDRLRSNIRLYQRRNLYGTELFYQVKYTLRYRRRKQAARKLFWVFFWINMLVIILLGWMISCEQAAHTAPSWEQEELAGILGKPVLEEEDYKILRCQTGLSPQLIDELRSQGRETDILLAQEKYFQPVEIRCRKSTILTHQEYLADESGEPVKGMPVFQVEDGDILITFCSHFLGWRNGHAAIVVDAEERLTLEAQVLGSFTCIDSLDNWEYYPSFLVLRPIGMEEEDRQEVAAYAREKLQGIPYRLSALTDMTEGDITVGTQCAHLVWYAYYRAGCNLDSDGGWIVTPGDIARSPLLEVVQSYGMNDSPVIRSMDEL